MIGDGVDDVARNLELAAGHVAHARGAGNVAGVVEGDDAVVVGRLVEFEPTLLDQIPGHLADMRGLPVVRIELLLQFDGERIRFAHPGAGTNADQGVPEGIGDAPGMAAFADHDALDAEFQRGFAHTQRDLAQLFVVADEHAEVSSLGGLRRQGPGNAGGVKDLAVADQAFDVRLGEEVGRWRDQQHFGAVYIERILDVDAGVFLDVFLDALQGIDQRRTGQSQVVADSVHLADDLVRIFLAVAGGVENRVRGHGYFGGVDAVGAVQRAAPALRALPEVGVPVVEHFLRQIPGADQAGEKLAGHGEVAPVNAAHQVLARHRHVLRIGGAEEVVALVGAGAAMDAGVHEYLECATLAEQFAHLGDCHVMGYLPVIVEPGVEAQGFLNLLVGDVGSAVLHRVRLQGRNARHVAIGGRFDLGLLGGLRSGGRCGHVSHVSSSRREVRPRAPDGALHAGCRPGCGSARRIRRVRAAAC